MLLGRLNGLVLRFNRLLQFTPQVLPVLPKILDLSLPLRVLLPQPVDFLPQPDGLQPAFL